MSDRMSDRKKMSDKKNFTFGVKIKKVQSDILSDIIKGAMSDRIF